MAGRILIVEDEFMVAAMIQTALKRAGYDVAGVSGSCASALEALNSGGIDAVTLDLSLSGGESSLPLAKILEERNVPYVIISGYDANIFASKERLNPTGVVGKPFPIGDLIEAMARCFALRSSG